MRRATLKRLPALLVPLALAWVADAQGIALEPWVAVASVATAALLLAATPAFARRREPFLAWLAALVGWTAVAAVLRPVAPAPAAWCVAAGAVALALAAVARSPRGAAWARAAVLAAATATSAWLIAESAILGQRPAGPLGNPNLAATVVVLGLALIPWLPASRAVRAGLAAFLLAGVVVSSSRGALVAVVAIAAVWGLSAAPLVVRRLALLAGAVAAAGLIARVTLDRDPLRFDRLRLWGVAARTAVAELPFGCGPGGYADAALPHNFPRLEGFARYHRIPTLAESDALQLAATLGLPGLAIGAALLASALAAVRRGGARAAGVGIALAVTSAVNTQLAVPVLAWTAVLAVAGSMARPRGRALEAPAGLTVALALSLGVPAAVALTWPRAGLGEDPGRLLAAADRLERAAGGDAARADAAALIARATELAPRSARAWRQAGSLALERAQRRGEASLADQAVVAYRHARAVNPLDAWAAFGEARALHALGRGAAAAAALRAAVELEPHFVPAWTELASIALENGQVGAARTAVEHAERAYRSAWRAGFVSDYEHALAAGDPRLLARLRAATGAAP